MKHIKIILIFSFLLILFSVSKAQRFEGGIIAGLSGTQVDGDTYAGYRKVGLYSGFFVRLPITERLEIQGEIAFSQKGSRRIPDEKNNDYTHYTLKLNYVDIPVLLRYNFSDKFGLESGFNFGVITRWREYLHYEPIDYGDFYPLEWAFALGMFYNINDKIGFGIRNSRSLLSIRKTTPNGSVKRIFDAGQYNDVLTLYTIITL